MNFAEPKSFFGPVQSSQAMAEGKILYVPGGTFRMGSDRHYPEEAPVHRVTVDVFWSTVRRSPKPIQGFRQGNWPRQKPS